MADVVTLNDDLMTPGFFWWFLLAAFVGLLVFALVGARREVRRAKAARKAELWARIAANPKPVRTHPHCAVWGHRYVAHQKVWLCGVCGDRIPRDTLLLEEEDIG